MHDYIIGTVLLIASLGVFAYTIKKYGYKLIIRRVLFIALSLALAFAVFWIFVFHEYDPKAEGVMDILRCSMKSNAMIVIGLTAFLLTMGILFGVKKYSDDQGSSSD